MKAESTGSAGSTIFQAKVSHKSYPGGVKVYKELKRVILHFGFDYLFNQGDKYILALTVL